MRKRRFFAKCDIRRAVRCAGAFLAFGLLFSSGTAVAADSAVFILDASGSMWGQIEPQGTKIEAAREVMGDLLSKLPDAVEVGFVAYGHRRKGDCSDIEVIEAPLAGAGPSIASRLPNLIPRGKTPISDALVAGAEALAFRGGRNSLVLVSDGIETCAADPCAVAETLASAHVDLEIHVVGLDVDDAARAQLQCIAEKGKGEYFTADNLFELTDALSTVTTAIAQAEPLPPPPPPPPPPPAVTAPQGGAESTRVRIQLGTTGTVRITPASWVSMPPYYWQLVDPETGEVVVQTDEGETLVKTGTYQLVWRGYQHGGGNVAMSTVVTVKGGETTEAPIHTGLRLTLPQGMTEVYYWQLRDSEGAVVAQYSILDAVPVPAGRYRLVLRQTQHGHQEADLGEIDIVAGQLNEVVGDQGVDVQWPADWVSDTSSGGMYYANFTNEDENVVSQASERGPLILAPGKYRVVFRFGQHGWSEAEWGTIEVPELGFVSPGFTSGITFISDELDPDHTIYARNLDTDSVAYIDNHWGPFPLAPGRYSFEYKRDGESAVTIVDELVIEPGVMLEAEM